MDRYIERFIYKVTSVRRFPVFFSAFCSLIVLLSAVFSNKDVLWEHFEFTLKIFLATTGLGSVVVGGEKITKAFKGGE